MLMTKSYRIFVEINLIIIKQRELRTDFRN